MKRRLSFRARLSLIITAVFIAAGAGLLAVQYAVVQQLFATAMRVTTVSCQGDRDFVPMPGVPNTGCQVFGPGIQGQVQSELEGGDETVGAVLQQSIYLSNEVSGGLLVWSIVMLVVFAVISAAIASWLARRSLDRIGEVTAATREITERDLGRRLDLPGPDDEIKELGDTIDEMLDRLELAFAAQNRFVANASHELRTPLTTTKAALEIPLRQGDVPTELEPAIRTALRATEQSERLITALLSLARGTVELEHSETVELSELAAEELESIAAAAAERGVAVASDLVACAVEGDPAILERAVRNLLDNGIRHNIDGGSLWLRTGESDGIAFIEVENTGAELSAETVALLREPFYRGADSRTNNSEGVGLGIAIVDSIALTHGGRLDLVARPSGGLIARLVLPSAR